ncbi:MAG: glycosyltransferase [Marmoricola sp.]
MPRALFIVNHNATIYNVRRELLQRLVGNGFEVFIAVPTHERNQAFRDLGCTVIDTPVSRFGTNPIIELATIARFVRVIRKVRPDVVLTYTVKANAYGGIAAQVCRVPYIGTVTGLGAVFQSPGLLQRISANLQRFAFRKAHKVFFQNSTNLKTFRNLSIVGEQAALVPGSGVNLKLHSLEPYSL